MVEVICKLNSKTVSGFLNFKLALELLCRRICIEKIEYKVLACFLSQGGPSKGMFSVYGKRGDETQT